MDRIYLDYNATSPLAPAVKRWLAKGEFVWANPAAQNSAGKEARARLDEVIRYLHKTFHLASTTHRVIFHSGATEGINAFFAGLAKGKTLFVFSPLDHSAVRAQKVRLEQQGHGALELKVDGDGNLRIAESIALIKERVAQGGYTQTLVNWTWVHNETGVVWPLQLALELKMATGALIHVDAVQAPGKVKDWDNLLEELDAYTFSGHKFGSLKGVGFSFQSLKLMPTPLLLGGGQQEGARSGTENVMGAWSLQLALEDLKQSIDPIAQQAYINDLRHWVDQLLRRKGRRIAAAAQELNLNTIFIVLDSLPADLSLPLFDLAGLEVSAGSACSSGTAKPSAVLLGLGEHKLARHGLRLSVSWAFSSDDLQQIKARLKQVLDKIPSLNV